MPKISINELNKRVIKVERIAISGKKWYVAMAIIITVNSLAVIKILTTI
jgi:hypothetical protein